MTPDHINGPSAEPATGDGTGLAIGGVCAAVGAVAFAVLRTLHGDTPGVDAPASLAFVTARPWYAGVHIGAVFAALLGVAGLVALAGSLRAPAGRMLGTWGVASALVGLGIFGVESTSEGLALPELARAAATAAPEQRGELVRAAHAVLAATHGPSLVAVSIQFGVALVVFGAAMLCDGYPRWLGWAGVGIGAVTLAAATGQYLNPDLMPGFLIYGVLASVVAQLWLFALAIVLLSRARSARRTPVTSSVEPS
jgi:Domain of unknown function (DUF4386)